MEGEEVHYGVFRGIENAVCKDILPTLRDQFAMAALHQVREFSYEGFDELARKSYEVADAMLKAREGK